MNELLIKAQYGLSPEDLQRMSDRLREIVPEARTIQAHGRLAPTEL